MKNCEQVKFKNRAIAKLVMHRHKILFDYSYLSLGKMLTLDIAYFIVNEKGKMKDDIQYGFNSVKFCIEKY